MLTRRVCGFVERNALAERGLERAGSRVEDDTVTATPTGMDYFTIRFLSDPASQFLRNKLCDQDPGRHPELHGEIGSAYCICGVRVGDGLRATQRRDAGDAV